MQKLWKIIPSHKLSSVLPVLHGELRDTDPNFEKEYSDYIHRINKHEIFEKLSPADHEKIGILVRVAFLAVINARYHDNLPLNIYGKGIYSHTSRGRILVAGRATTRNQHYGLIKGHMPIPQDDIAYSNVIFPYLKASDQAIFRRDALWVKSNFNHLVHPFSNSISGVVLCQLKLCAQFRNEGKKAFTDSGEEMSLFFKLMTSAILFYGGGHTLQEFIAPFSLMKVKKEFETTPRFNRINLETMYYSDNEISFNEALNKTIHYNKIILLKSRVRAQITSVLPLNSKETTNLVLSKLQLMNDSRALLDRLSEAQKQYAARTNHYFFTFQSNNSKKVFVQEKLGKAITYFKSNLISQAKHDISELKELIYTRFGRNGLLGHPSKTYLLVSSLEESLSALVELQTNVAKHQDLTFKQSASTDSAATCVSRISSC